MYSDHILSLFESVSDQKHDWLNFIKSKIADFFYCNLLINPVRTCQNKSKIWNTSICTVQIAQTNSKKNVVHSVHSHDITRFALLILRNGSNKRFFFYAKRKHKTYSSEIACEIQDKYKHLILMRQQKEYNADKRCIWFR